MGALEDIGAWLGLNPALVGWVLGLILISVMVVSVALATDGNGIATVFMGSVGVVLCLVSGIWPAWVGLILVLGLAVMLMFGHGTQSSGSRGT